MLYTTDYVDLKNTSFRQPECRQCIWTCTVTDICVADGGYHFLTFAGVQLRVSTGVLAEIIHIVQADYDFQAAPHNTYGLT